MKLTIERVAYHRNGISGQGFYVVCFIKSAEPGEPAAPMVGVVFQRRGHVAVFDRAKLAQADIFFAQGNSWRGDNFEPALRQAITDYDDSAGRDEDVDAHMAGKVYTAR
jgi:hypothetical protein